MRCARCGGDGVERLPPNSFSRTPGFRCPRCQALMRPPGSGLSYAGVIGLGAAFVLGGLAVVVAFVGEDGRAWAVGGFFWLAGLTVTGWAVDQLRRPTPLR